jgi:hypothetical protein
MLYVDKLFQALPTGTAKKHGKQWCHLWPTDATPESLQELHEMALAIGLKRSYFQNHKWFPHYDLVPSKRKLAIKQGAIEKSLPEWIEEQGGLRALATKNGEKAND